jgi:hypothetical protein
MSAGQLCRPCAMIVQVCYYAFQMAGFRTIASGRGRHPASDERTVRVSCSDLVRFAASNPFHYRRQRVVLIT